MENAQTSYSPNASPNSLAAAIAYCERSLRCYATSGGGIPEGEQASYEWQALEQWALEQQRSLTEGFSELQKGGREHEVFLHSETGRWVKSTHAWLAGYTVEVIEGSPVFLNATPLQYLSRQRLQNRMFGDDIRLEGIRRSSSGLHLVISQPDILGEAPSAEQISVGLHRQHGFDWLNIPPMGYYKSESYLRFLTGLFDAHPANFRVTDNGILIPIDIILVRFSAEDAAALRRNALD